MSRIRVGIVIALVVAIAAVIAGCGGSDNSSSSTSTPATTEATTTAATTTAATTTEATTTEATTTAATTTEATTTAATTAVAGDAVAGKVFFEATCQGCHLADGTQAGVGPVLAGGGRSAERIRNQVINGGGPMPAGLATGADLDNVTAYVLSIQ